MSPDPRAACSSARIHDEGRLFARSRPGRPRYGLRQAPRRHITMFDRMGLPAVPVDASSGAMGGSGSTSHGPLPRRRGRRRHLFQLRLRRQHRTGHVDPARRGRRDIPELERFRTPGVRTIKALEEIDGGVPAEHQIKTMVMVLDGQVTLALCAATISPTSRNSRTPPADRPPAATPEEAYENLGACPAARCGRGRGPANHRRPLALGPLRSHHRRQRGRLHYTGVSVGVHRGRPGATLREVSAGEACPR